MAASPSTPDSAQQAAEKAALNRMLELSQGSFSLSISICNSPALRDYLIGEIKGAKPQLTVVSVPRETVDVFGYVDGQCADAATEALFVVDLEGSIDSSQEDQPALRSLNASRELWERRYQCPIVFWLPEYAATLMSTAARDFWRYRSHRFEFVSEQATAMAGTSDSFAGSLSLAANLSAEEKQFRIAELEERVADAGSEVDEKLARHVFVWLAELGFLYWFCGRLDDAEATISESLRVGERYGWQRYVGIQYGHLGIVYLDQGDLKRAEEMHCKAIAIHERLGDEEHTASNYGNLGLIWHERGNLDRAAEMHTKSLKICEKFGRKKEMANDYGNLGIIYFDRENLEGAEDMHRKALAINEEFGRLDGMAASYGNIGAVYAKRGDLERAEEMFHKALRVFEKLGHHVAIANTCDGLGRLAVARDNRAAAREFWSRARDLYEQAEMSREVSQIREKLDDLAVGP